MLLYFFLAFPLLFIAALIYFVRRYIFQAARLRKENPALSGARQATVRQPATSARQQLRLGQVGLLILFLGAMFWRGAHSSGPDFGLLLYAWIFFAYFCWKLFLAFGPPSMASRIRTYLVIDVLFTFVTFSGTDSVITLALATVIAGIILYRGWQIPLGLQESDRPTTV